MTRKMTGRKEVPSSRRSKRTLDLFRMAGLSPSLVLVIAVLVLGAIIVSKSPETSHLQQLRRRGAFYLTTSSRSFRQRLTSLFQLEDSPVATLAASLREGQPVRFVPNGLSLANLPQLQEVLQTIPASDRELLQKFPGLDVALAARLLRHSNISGVAEITWIQSLPNTWPFSWSLSDEQKRVLQGTKAQRPIATNDQVLSLLEDMEVQGQPLSHSDAKWILGFFLHHSLEGQFLPGLLDGLVRHWDLNSCAGLAKNTAATGRLPGWALLAQKVMKAGEQVFLCSEQPNGQLLAMYGVMYPDNPTGVALTQASVKDQLLDAMLQQAQLTCDYSEVRSLFLRRQEELLTARNLRCASVLWLGGGAAAHRAMSAGYLDSWPRLDGKEAKKWQQAEVRLYQLLMKECNASREGLQAVDVDVLQGVKLENSRMSNSVLLVREQELQLFEHCLRWSAARVEILQQTISGSQPKGAKAASGGQRMMEEL